MRKRIPTKTNSSEAKCLLGGKRVKYPWIDTQTGSERVPQARSFESLSWGDSSGFLLTNHLALPGSESVFDLSESSCHASVCFPRFFVSLQQRFGVTDIKASLACCSSQVLDRPCYSSQVSNGPCYSS